MTDVAVAPLFVPPLEGTRVTTAKRWVEVAPIAIAVTFLVLSFCCCRWLPCLSRR
jgi:hypothetical protein